MTNELLEHVCRMLLREPTRTASARALHQRTVAATGTDIGYGRFLDVLRSYPDRVTVTPDPVPLDDGWSARDRQRYAAALERAGLTRGATVVLVDAQGDRLDHDDPRAGLAPDDDTLAAVHASVIELVRIQRDAGALPGMLDQAVMELNELGAAFASLQPPTSC